MPGMSIFNSEKNTLPETAIAAKLDKGEMVAFEGLLPIVRLTILLLSVVTRFPPASKIIRWGVTVRYSPANTGTEDN